MFTLDDREVIESEFRDYVRSGEFPCVGAKSALAREGITTRVYEDISRPFDDVELRDDLRRFIRSIDRKGPTVQSFAAIFSGPEVLSEEAFEAALWNRLQCLHNLDAVTGAAWARETSPDPASPHFSVSICGEAFFVIGLHPDASRPARRFRYPTLIFNSHDQFDRLREDGRFEIMKKIIRKNELATAGSINPMLNDFGDASEARQYSGREVEENWECPFRPKV